MANPEHESKIKEGGKRWNEWRATNAEWRPDLVGVVLAGMDLREANLAKALLIEANLIGALLEGANLDGANLRWANLTDANLTGANLARATLREANLTDANLTGANLGAADLRDADLRRADLRKANFDGAKIRGAKFEGSVSDAGLLRRIEEERRTEEWQRRTVEERERRLAELQERPTSGKVHRRVRVKVPPGPSNATHLHSPESDVRRTEDIQIIVSPEIRPDQLMEALSALADLYRACGGVGFDCTFDSVSVSPRGRASGATHE